MAIGSCARSKPTYNKASHEADLPSCTAARSRGTRVSGMMIQMLVQSTACYSEVGTEHINQAPRAFMNKDELVKINQIAERSAFFAPSRCYVNMAD